MVNKGDDMLAQDGVTSQPATQTFPVFSTGVSCISLLVAKSVDKSLRRVNLTARLSYAFLGLVTGDAVLLFYLLQAALRARAYLVAAHMGDAASTVPLALQLFVVYGLCSVVGWLIIGVPTVLLFPVRLIARLSWPQRLLVGATLGPLALLSVIVLLACGHLSFPASFTGTRARWAYSVVVSTVSFAVYAALLRRRIGS